MSKKTYLTILLILFISAILIFALRTSYTNTSKATAQHLPKVLVIYKSGTDNYLDIFQNYNQSYILNAKVTSTDDSKVSNLSLKDYDLVYPDISLISSPNIDKIKPLLIEYTLQGGYLFLENEYHKILPQDFTGVKSYIQHNDKNYNFNYPNVDYNLSQLQITLRCFFDNLIEYRKEDLNNLQFNKAILGSAQSIANIDDYSIMSVNKYQNGFVLMCSSLLPNSKFISGFDLRAKNPQQPYFDYAFSTINYFIRNEFLSFSIKEKQGFVLKKVFGPYGRPAMAWQNHYEGLSSIKDKEAIMWIDLLKEYNQIPSFSLIRGAFDWGQWKSDITVHINTGSNEKPEFLGEHSDSYYSSGQRIIGNNDYITFGTYPEYKNLSDPINLPHRAYPTVTDYDNDGDKDLIVGSPDGKLYLVKNIGTSTSPLFDNKEPLLLENNNPALVDSYAAPIAYDINKDGLFDLIVGNGQGTIDVFINNGSLGKPSFLPPTKLTDHGTIIKVNGSSAPNIGDIDNDNVDDLIIGNSSGTVSFYKGVPGNFKYIGEIINQKHYSNLSKCSAPLIYDWNHDGQNDILLGDNTGTIKIFINNHGTFTYNGNIEGMTYNSKGTHDLIGGHNSVPLITDWNGDGINDLIVGQLEFSPPYNIDSKYFKYKNELQEIIDYAKINYIPIYPHIFTHGYRTLQQEAKELELHKKAFKTYNLAWSNSGTDQHTWKISSFEPQQTLINQMNNKIWWNFGFNPPNEPDLPREGKEYMWSTPFLLSQGERVNKFIAFTPSPNLFLYPNAYNSFKVMDMPITYFEHIEYRFSKPHALNELKQMVVFLNTVQKDSEYNFLTQEQMAKSFINTFFSNANIKIKDNKITITPDISFVPSLAGEYKNTLGLKLEKGEKYKDLEVLISSPIQTKIDDNIYFGVDKKTNITLNTTKLDDFYIVRSNVPIKINTLFNKTTIKTASSGMQQIKVYSENTLNIKGENIKVENEDKFYTITHYGKPVTIILKH